MIGLWILAIGAFGLFVAGHWAIWTLDDMTTLGRFAASAGFTLLAGVVLMLVQP